MTRGENGLITHVDGKPVRDFLREEGDRRAADLRRLMREGSFSEADLGKVYGIGIDTRTGRIMEAVNGRPYDFTPPGQLHPALGDRMDTIRQGGPYPNFDNRGHPIPEGDRRGATTTYPHFESNPSRHAEIKITNELLEQRGRGAPPGTMSEFRMDTRFIDHNHGPGADGAAFCATCHRLLSETPSNSGRNTEKPGNPDKQFIPE